jgi:hypothetical protein
LQPTTTSGSPTKPSGEQPVAMLSTGEQPVEIKPSGEQPVGMNPTGEQPGEMNPTGESPVPINPTGGQPVPIKPTWQQPVKIDSKVKPSTPLLSTFLSLSSISTIFSSHISPTSQAAWLTVYTTHTSCKIDINIKYFRLHNYIIYMIGTINLIFLPN